MAFEDVPDSPLLRSPVVRVQEERGTYRLTLADGTSLELRGDYLENVDISEMTASPPQIITGRRLAVRKLV
jgi:hypothetical protein